MDRHSPRICLLVLAILGLFLPELVAQQPPAAKSLQAETARTDWTYRSEVFPLDLKWRRHLESNLRWMIARGRLAPTVSNVPRVALYADAGTNHLLNRNIVHTLEAEGIRCRVLDRSRIVPPQLRDVEAYVVPGGYSTFQNTATGDRGLLTIRQFVEGGGRYLGICAGAFMASRDVLWEEEHFPYPLALFDGTAEGALDHIAPFPTDAGVSLKLTNAGKLRGLTTAAEGQFYYKGGPRFHGGTDFTVLAQYQDGTAAIISRPYGRGEVVLNGIHYERPSPQAAADNVNPTAPRAARAVFQALLRIKGNSRLAIVKPIDQGLTRWVEVTDLALEDRLNLEQNLRWMLARTVHTSATSRSPTVGLFADAGAEHASMVGITTLLESNQVPVQALLHTDLTTSTLAHFKTIIIPAGDHRILRDTLGEKGQQALAKFVNSGGQFIAISTGAYFASKTVRWFQRSWEYPIQFHTGMAEGPLAEVAPWPSYAQVTLQVTEAGMQHGLTQKLLARCQYHGGPKFVGGEGHQVLARYPDQSAAIIVKKTGKGQVLLVGVDISRITPGTNGSQFLLKLLSPR
jgi:glutamine amidotransferase-like uncharacterized protein